ncbi:MAG: DUF5123 domain-containing protein [Candidatus Marinimicrobia bacterium]|nr:DUF5123 domain-containing protein [Candidatus Neomarinimicrobiota bacterium]
MKKLLIAICLMTLAFGMLQAAVIPVVNDSDSSLVTAYNNAAAGDILELTVDGVYLSKAQIELDMDITIRAAEWLDNKPVYKYVGTSTGAYMFKGVGSPRISISGIEFQGDGTAEGAAGKAKYLARLDNGDPTATMDFFLDNCVVNDFNDKFIKPYGNCGLDSIVVTNSSFSNGASEGIVLYSGSSSDPAIVYTYAEISGNTFYAIEREAIKGQTATGGVVRIDRNTFYDCGNVENKPMMYFRDVTDVVVKNSIFANSQNADAGEEFADLTSDATLFMNNVMWDIVNSDIGNATASDTLTADPMFADAANGDFTIGNDVLLTFADDGGAVGDPYWVPNRVPAVYQVTNADTNSIADAIADAISGDVIELVSDGLYLNTSQIVIEEDITIRAWDLLPNRPVVKYIGTSTGAYMFKGVGSPRIEISGIEFQGDGTAEGGAGKAKYLARLDNGDPTATMDFFLYDCVVNDFNDKFIKPYGNCGLDSIVVKNNVFSNGASEGIVLYSGSSSDPAIVYTYAEITGNTFYAIEREAIKGQTATGGMVRIDRNTFYDCGNVENKPMMYFRDVTDVVVKNSIFANSQNADSGEEFADLSSDAVLFTNNLMWDIVNSDIGNATVTDTLTADPMFADAANADFTVGNPAAMTLADDGGAVGDPRWIEAMAVVVTEVTNDLPNALQDAVAASSPGDILELVSEGIYVNDDDIEVPHDLTIRGAAGLATQPVVKYNGGSSSYFLRPEANVRLAVSNLEFDGIRDGGSLVKYFVRIDNSDPTALTSLFVDNVVAHDFADKVIKPYGNSGIDSLVVRNSVFYNGASEGIMFYSGSSSDPATILNYGEVSNTTIYAMEREAIKSESYADAHILIDRVTVYDCGSVENKPMLRFRLITDLEIKNSIFVHNDNTDLSEDFADLGESANLFHHNAVWDVLNFETGSATPTDTVQMDPMFADAANGDFSIPEDSPLYSFADDGGSIGDTRWAPPLGVLFLNTFVVGEGSIELDPPGGVYAEDQTVTLTAVPAEYWAFDHWDPVITFPPNNPVATITMTESRNITAHFVPTLNNYAIDLATIGYGHIVETVGHQYPLDEYIEGDTLELVAVADSANWEFAYWVNAEMDSIADGDIYYLIDADTSFTALFRSTNPQAMLATATVGMGSVTVSPMPVPGFDTYDAGTELTVTANAPLGWEFGGWSGDITSTDNPLMITLTADMAVTATFTEISHPDGILAIDSSWELMDALEYTKYNSQAYRILLTDVGPYEPGEELREEGKMPELIIDQTVEILGADTLSAKPWIKGYTSSNGGSSSEGFFRLKMNGHLTLKNVGIDGWMDGATVPAKYIVRADDSGNFGFHTSIRAFDVDFKSTIEAFYKNYPSAFVDSMIFDHCVIEDIGKEGIFMNSVGDAAMISITNTTFKRVAREVLYLKTMNPVIFMDHLTIDTCGYGNGSEGAKFGAVRIENTTDVTFTNSIINNVPNTTYEYGLRIAGENSYVDNLLLNNVPMDLQMRDDATLGPDVFWYDPMFADVTAEDYTLGDDSYAYHLQNDESAAIGDLRWATSTNITAHAAMNLMVEGNGSVELSPLPTLKFYAPSTVVTLTATPDSLAQFDGYSGDLVSTDAVSTVTMDGDKMIYAEFSFPTYLLTLNARMGYQIFAGNFNADTDSLDVAGSMNDWSGGDDSWLMHTGADSIWSVTFEVPALGDLHFEYKLRINGNWDTSEFPFGGPNRVLDITGDTEVTIWYNDEDYTTSLDDNFLPDVYALNQNYPNPFNPSTTISFDLIETADTRLVLYDVRGRELERIVDQSMAPGRYTVTFNGSALASGVYFYRLTSGEFSDVKKLMLLK